MLRRGDGQRVKRGQLLVQLDDTLQQAQLKQSEAQSGIARTSGLVLHRQAGALRQRLDGIDKVQAVVAHHEPQRIAATSGSLSRPEQSPA